MQLRKMNAIYVRENSINFTLAAEFDPYAKNMRHQIKHTAFVRATNEVTLLLASDIVVCVNHIFSCIVAKEVKKFLCWL